MNRRTVSMWGLTITIAIVVTASGRSLRQGSACEPGGKGQPSGAIGPDAPRTPPASVAAPPAIVEVLDDETGKPVPEFSFCYGVVTPGSAPPEPCGKDKVQRTPWRAVRSAEGHATFAASVSCQLTLYVRANGFSGPY